MKDMSIIDIKNTIKHEIERHGNVDVVINNVQVDLANNQLYVIVDASYAWYLHGSRKNVHNPDMRFISTGDNGWEYIGFL